MTQETPMAAQPNAPEQQAAIREQVRERYAHAAQQSAAGILTEAEACCSDSCCNTGAAVNVTASFGCGLYPPDEQDALPKTALLASLGCGNPTAVAELHAGERVLDLGSGGGIDVLLSARRVGPAGKAYGLDMTGEMLALAERNAAGAGVINVEFLKGYLETIPLPAAAVDVVISNCVINLSADKPAVFAETHRVLRPGGRFGVSDVVAEDRLSPADRAERGDHVGCIAGALSTSEYRDGLAAAGFTGIDIILTRQLADGIHSAIIRAVKPA